MSEPSPELNDSTNFTRRFLRLCYTQEFLGGRAKDATKDAVKNGNFLALLVFCCSGTRSSQGTCILQGKRNCSGVDHTNNTLLETWVRSLLFKDLSRFSYNHLGSVICRNSHLDKETNPSPLWGPIGGQALCCPWCFPVTARACFPSASNYLVYYCLDILPELVNWKMSGEFYIPKDNNKDVGKVG